MARRLAEQAGSALVWRASELGAGRLVSLLKTLVLARLLVPDDFGLMAIASVSLYTILQVTELGVVPALMQRPEVEERHYDAGWSLGLARALAVALLVFLASPAIAAIFGEQRAIPILRVLALRPVLEALVSIKVAELGRRLQFRPLALIRLSGFLIDAMVAVALAEALGVWALVAGALVGAIATMMTSYIWAPYRPRVRLAWSAMRPLAHYGRWLLLASVLAVAGSTVLQMVISRRFGAASLGLYFLAGRLALLPSEVAHKVVGEVAFPAYARLQDQPEATARAARSVITGLFAMLVPVYALLLVLAPRIVEDLLGPRWQGTAELLRILALVGILGLFGDALVPLFKGLGRPAYVTLLEGTQTLMVLLSVWWLAERWGLAGATGSWLPGVVASQVVAAALSRKVIRHGLSELWRPLVVILAVAVIGSSVAFGLAGALSGGVALIAVGLTALALMAALLLGADARLRLGLVDGLARAFPRLAAGVERAQQREER